LFKFKDMTKGEKRKNIGGSMIEIRKNIIGYMQMVVVTLESLE